jgi:hypothetical protein
MFLSMPEGSNLGAKVAGGGTSARYDRPPPEVTHSDGNDAAPQLDEPMSDRPGGHRICSRRGKAG